MSGNSRSAAERYLSARRTSNLRLSAESRSDADVLLAAAYASTGHERKALALAVYGVMASTDMRGARAVADQLAGWLVRRSYKGRGESAMARVVAFDLALTVLKWFHRPTCLSCGGHGHPLRANSPVIDEGRECHACHGTGQIPLERLVRSEYTQHARWLAEELRVMGSLVFGDMSRRLRADMDGFK